MRKRYYRQAQIITSQYTSGGEYTLENGNNYVGQYHILPDSTYWTGSTQTTKSKFLYKKDDFEYSPEVARFKRGIKNKKSNYISPVPYKINISEIDYSYDTIERYFVQKTGTSIIIEIDIEQYQSINIRNILGLDGLLWIPVLVTWYLSKDLAPIKNKQATHKASKKIPGILNYLSNFLEYTK